MTSLSVLTDELRKIDQAHDDAWFSRLDERKQLEGDFHDKMRDQTRFTQQSGDTFEEFYTNRRFYRTAQNSRDYFYKWLDTNVRDKVVLDFACGDGKQAMYCAKAGAKFVVGIDISAISIANARQEAAAAGLSDRTYFLRGDCERTGLPDSSVDVVVCAGVLHHLDLSYAYPEIRRVLAPGGKVIAFEALDYNPLIKLYRMRTPQLRTEWEKAHILSLKDVRFAKRFFKIGEMRFWHMITMLGVWFPALLPMLNGIDRVLTRIPGLRLWSWMFTFELLSDKKAKTN
jgi:ubiquinone/menaquinone biosynthesis C-methylase UbiE